MPAATFRTSFREQLDYKHDYYIPMYDTKPKIYEESDESPLTLFQRAHNRTIQIGNIIDSTQFAAVGIRLFQGGIGNIEEEFDNGTSFLESHIRYVDSICHMTPIEYLKNDKIPLIQKVFDLVIGIPIAGAIEIASVTALPIMAAMLVTTVVIVFLTIALPFIIILGTLCCNRRDDPDKLAKDAILTGISTVTLITVGCIASGVRASLKLVPVLGMPAVKTFDIGLTMLVEKAKINWDGFDEELHEFAGDRADTNYNHRRERAELIEEFGQPTVDADGDEFFDAQ